MKVAELLDLRRPSWSELERLCDRLASGRLRSLDAADVSRFAALYRAACADLALADASQLPPNTVQYLHRLVGRAHNQLYRTRRFAFGTWSRVLFEEVPRRIFRDRCVQLAFCLFWSLFLVSAFLAYQQTLWPEYAEAMLTREGIRGLESSFQNPVDGRSPDSGLMMVAFYIQHNTGIGLKCFAGGLAVIPGIFVTAFNAAFLGAAFGYMARPDVVQGQNFFQFVTAHGPYELTAIVLSAGAGLRLGLSWLAPGRWSRLASLRRTAEQTLPLMGAAMAMFFCAALVEGLISPSRLPYWSKAAVAIVSTGMLVFYFVGLGVSGRAKHAV